MTPPGLGGGRPLRGALLLLTVILGFGACGPGEQERIPLGAALSPGAVAPLPPEIQELLDEGNAAYRRRDYAGALDHFTRVTEAEPALAAGWYGVVMVHLATGNESAAEAAMMEVHRLAPDIPLQHPSSEAPPNPHPILQ